MKTILTNKEIMVINQTAEFDSAIGFARAIEAAIIQKIGDAVITRFKHADDAEFKECQPRNAYVNTVQDTIDEIKVYISAGYKYELQPLYTIPFIEGSE